METILIVDDEQHYRSLLTACLNETGNITLSAGNAAEALQIINSADIDLIITDIKMPGMDGMSLMEATKKKKPDIPVIIMTAHGSIEMAVDAMQNGAFTFIQKPFTNESLLHFTEKALGFSRIIKENEHLRSAISSTYSFHNIIGKSKPIMDIRDIIIKAAPSHASILIEGESGTGKELVAKAIHYNSRKDNGPFIAVNCSALSESLLESELFGHEKGAFTGADYNKKGRFEMADSGTLFLDEIGELSLNLQIKLLRVLQEKKFERVGGTKTLSTNFRLITATNKNLLEESSKGRFRSDLFYRLNVIRISLPPLRERREDIHLLIHHFLKKYSSSCKSERSIDGIQPDCEKKLCEYNWPGNVRELENIIERASIFCSGNRISTKDLPADFMTPISFSNTIEIPASGLNLKQKLQETEIQLINSALQRTGGVQTKAADLLGIGKSGLNQKIKKYGIRFPDSE